MFDRGDGYWHHGHGFPILGWLVPLLVVAVLVGLILWAFLRPRGQAPAQHAAGAPRADAALTELRLRYARGELSRDDFLRMSADLGDSSPLA